MDLAFSLYCCRMAVTSWLKSCRSSGRTDVSATAVAVFLWTSAPNRDLDLTTQYGMSILRHTAGSHSTSSIGSTSCAMQTSCAFLSSQSLVMWLMPYLTYSGFFALSSSPPALAPAIAAIRSFFAAASSGRYLWRSLKRLTDRFLSSVLVNWLIDGGTLSRWYKILRCR